jgi:hypothetical protein
LRGRRLDPERDQDKGKGEEPQGGAHQNAPWKKEDGPFNPLLTRTA